MQIDTKNEPSGAKNCTDPSLPACEAAEELTIRVGAEIISDPAFAVSWIDTTAAKLGTKYLLDVSTDQACEQKVASFETEEKEYMFDFLRDGVYYVCLQSFDPLDSAAEKAIAANNGLRIVLDRTPPALTYPKEIEKAKTFEAGVTAEDLTTMLYFWEKVSGPGDVEFSDKNNPNSTISMTANGDYKIVLKVRDGGGNISEALISVTWDQTGPLVNAGPDQIAKNSVEINGTVDSSAVTMMWEMMSGPTGGKAAFSSPTKAKTNVMADTDGNYVVRLTAKDKYDNKSYDEMTYTRDTTPPTVDAGADITSGATVNLVGAATGAASVEWEKVSGPGNLTFGSSTATSTSVTADTTGIYIIKLTAEDLLSNAATDIMVLTWSSSSQPSVNVGNDLAIKSATLVNATSQNADTFVWTQVSGPGSITFTPDNTSEDVTISGSTDGTYVIKLRATNSQNGDFAEDDVTITVDTVVPAVDVGVDLTNNTFASVDATSGGTPDNSQTYQWTKVSGPGTITFGSPNSEDTNITASVDGTYVLRLTVTDISGNVASDDLTYIKDSLAPSVNAGADLSTRMTANINATVTGATTYLWTQESGVGVISFGNSTAEDTSVSADQDGTYVLKLTGTDAAGNAASDFVTLTWDTTPPTVNAGPDVTKNALFTHTATANGYSSVSWSAVSGPGNITFASGSSLSTTVTGDTDGAYVLRLTATDAAGNSSSDDVVLTWDTAAPNVDAGADVTARLTAAIDASISGAAAITWVKQSGPGTITFSAPSSEDTNVSASADGTYVLNVTAVDAAGNATSDNMTFIWDTSAPTINAGADVTTGIQVLLNAITSSATTYQWSMVSGPGSITFGSATSEDTTASADTEGTYVLRMDATDAAGNTASDFVNFTWDVTAPIVNVGSDIATFTEASIDATVTGGNTYQWSKVSGPGNLNFTSPTAIDTDISASADGIYIVRLTATDTAGNSASDDLTLDWDNDAPSVNAGADIVTKIITNINATVTGAVTYQWTQQSGPGTASFGSATAEDTSVTVDTNGVYVLRLTATDSAGNSNFDEVSFNWDTVPPSVDVGADVLARVQSSIDATTSDAVSYGWTKISGSGTVTFGSPSSEDTTVAASADGSYTLQLAVTDAAGNIAVDQMVFTWDTTAPSVNAGADVNTNAQVTLNAATAGGAFYEWTKQSGPGAMTFGTSTAEDTTASADTDGTYILRLTVTDIAGNSGYDEITFIWDTTVSPNPQFTSIDLINGAEDGYINLAERSSSLKVVGNLSASSYDVASFQLVGFTSDCSSQSGYSTTIPAANAASFGSDGDYKVCVRLSKAGHSAIYGESDKIVLDTEPAVFGSLPLDNDTADGYVNNTDITNMLNIVDTIIGVDIASTQYALALSSASCSNVTGWAAIPSSGMLAGFADSTYKVCAKMFDVAGNITYDGSPNFILDKTSPSFSNLVLLNTDVGNSHVANATDLVYSVNGVGFNDASYKVSPTSANCGTVTYDGPDNTIPKASDITALTDGIYKVCVRLTDDAQNPAAYGTSNNFEFDRGSPSLPLNPEIFIWQTNDQDIDISWLKATDSFVVETELTYKIYYSTNSSFDTLAEVEAGTPFGSGDSDIEEVQVTGLSPNTTYYFNLVVQDPAGNKSVYNKLTQKTYPAMTYTFSDVSVGFDHACALTTDSKTYCWGNGAYGALAKNAVLTPGTNADSDHIKHSPVRAAKGYIFTQIATGNIFSCGIANNGNTYCWGRNNTGQLGDNSFVDKPQPVLVAGAHTFTEISAGSAHVCGIDENNVAYCWGSNSHGQLGNNSTIASNVPVAVDGGATTFTKISAGGSFTCGIDENNVAYCWGRNNVGQLGNNDATFTNQDEPTLVSGGLTFNDIAAGWLHACGIATNGSTYCWGSGGQGEIGNNAILDRRVPTLVSGSHNFTSVYAGYYNSCAINSSNSAYCWGANFNGQGGDGTTVNKLVPTAVSSGGVKFTHLTLSTTAQGTVCGLSEAQKIYCWGDDVNGVLGNGVASTADVLQPALILFNPYYKSVQLADDTAHALNMDNNFYTWGEDYNNATYGNGHMPYPQLIPTLNNLNINYVVEGMQHGCGIAKGDSYCWGEDEAGNLGLGFLSYAAYYQPMPTVTNEKIKTAYASYPLTCWQTFENKVYCSGYITGAMGGGDGSWNELPVLTRSANIEPYSNQLRIDDENGCGLNSSNQAYCWGENGNGQLGIGTTGGTASPPVAVAGGHTFKQLGGASYTMCGITMSGTLYCWGQNLNGQLGDGTNLDKDTPTQVSGALTFTKLSDGKAAAYHQCAITTGQDLYCWGDNSNGQLGDGTQLSRLTPTLVLGGHKWLEVAVSQAQTCGLTTEYNVLCWGWDYYGTIGNDGVMDFPNEYFLYPVYVAP